MKHGLVDDQFYSPLDPFARRGGTTDVFDPISHVYSSYVHNLGLLKYRSNKGLALTLSGVPDSSGTVYVHESGKALIKIPKDETVHVLPFDGQKNWALYFDGHVRGIPKDF